MGETAGYCGDCRRQVGSSTEELADHVLSLHVPFSARSMWKCSDCAFDAPELRDAVRHCFSKVIDFTQADMNTTHRKHMKEHGTWKVIACKNEEVYRARHDVGRLIGREPRPMLDLLRRFQCEAEEDPVAVAPYAPPTFTAAIKTGPAFSLDDISGRPSSDEGSNSTNGVGSGPPALKRGPPSLSEELLRDDSSSRFKSPRLDPPPTLESNGLMEPALELSSYMETRAESKSGSAQDERTMKAYAWLLCREMYPEALLAGFDCVPNSLHFGKYQQCRNAEETLERQPLPVRQILESTMRKFHFTPGSGLPEEARHNRMRTVLDHLKTNRYNIRRKLSCPCGGCKKPQPADSFLFDASPRTLFSSSPSA